MTNATKTNSVPTTVSHRRDIYRAAVISSTAVFALVVYLILPASINELQRRMIAIFLVAAIFWATEVLPLFATSLMVVGFQILFLADVGGLAKTLPAMSAMPDGSISYTSFLSSFGSPIIILFMGGFLLSAALTKHKLDLAIAAKILKPLSESPMKLIFGVLFTTAFFSMWMSNTATTAMMLAIVAPVLKSLPDDSRFARGLILAVPFGANVGGVGTPIGTPPNAIAFGNINASGDAHLSFLDWMMFAVPLELVLLVFIGLFLYYVYSPKRKLDLKMADGPTTITWRGWITTMILLLAIVLWMTGDLTGLKSAGVALLVAASLTAFGVLDRHDVDSIDWNILILMWGGLSMGAAMETTGLTGLINEIDFNAIPGGAWVIGIVIAVIAVGLSTFMSNTAAANLIVPIAMALSVGGASTRIELALLAGLSCSFAMSMPVSTPPNAIAFATGRIPVGSMIRTGTVITIVSLVILLLGYRTIFPLVLRGALTP